jgi:hypothetical protein
MDSEVMSSPKKKHTLTHSLNNIGIRDASASKNHLNICRRRRTPWVLLNNKKTEGFVHL